MRALLLAVPLVLLLAACASDNKPEEGERLSGPGLYIALGNSLSEGVGASDRDATAFVPLVRGGLDEDRQLINLARSGDTSEDLVDSGYVDAAAALVGYRNGDDDPDNDAKLVTLEIGGNDLLNLFDDLVLSGTCPGLKEFLAEPECVDTLRQTLERFQPTLSLALDRLQEVDSEVPIVVMTLYNSLSGGIGLAAVDAIEQLAEMSLEGLPDTPFPEGLNDIIRRETEERNLILVDLYPLFESKANEYIAHDFIHPNDGGHEVVAEAVLEAVR